MQPSKPPRVLWPLPPQEPQLEFISTYTTKFDILPPTANHTWHNFLGDSTDYLFSRPFGLAIDDRDDSIVLSDMAQGTLSRIRFSPAIRLERLPFRISRPHGVDLDSKGNLYVIDGGQKKILVYSADNRPLRSFGGDRIFGNPSFIAVNEKIDRIYVSDGARHRIAVFDTSGSFLFYIGEPGSAPGQFAAPQGLEVDGKNRLFVADMLNARIQVLDADGNFLFMFGQRCAQPWCFEGPKDLALTGDGTLFVVDYRKGLLLAYSQEGEFLFATGGGSQTAHPLGFSMPAAIGIDSSDRIFISDYLNRRVSAWQYLSDEYLEKNPLTDRDRRRLKVFSKKIKSVKN